MSRIHNRQSLETEIRFLSRKAKQLEQKLDHNVDELRQNLGGMAMNSIFGALRDQDVVSAVTERLFYGSKLQDGIVGIVDKLSDFFTRIFPKKKD